MHKIETIGDCYVAAAGLQLEKSDERKCDAVVCHEYGVAHARDLLGFAKALLTAAASLKICMRVGLHAGPVMSGVVGERMPRFCLLGETISQVDRIQGAGQKGKILASRDFAELARHVKWKAANKDDASGPLFWL